MPHTMTAIRDHSPCPQRFNCAPFHTGEDAYCVGGAVCRTAWGVDTRPDFPDPEDVALALQQLRPALDYFHALDIAEALITANDTGHFTTAWQWVAYALGERDDAPWQWGTYALGEWEETP